MYTFHVLNKDCLSYSLSSLQNIALYEPTIICHNNNLYLFTFIYLLIYFIPSFSHESFPKNHSNTCMPKFYL